MATRTNATSKLTLKVTTGTDSKGEDILTARTVSHLNPALTDEDARGIGEKIAALQGYPLAAVSRTDTAQIAAEA